MMDGRVGALPPKISTKLVSSLVAGSMATFHDGFGTINQGMGFVVVSLYPFKGKRFAKPDVTYAYS